MDSLGRPDILLPTLVASTHSSRVPCSSSPTMVSDAPSEYTSAVSMKFTPIPRAWATISRASSSGVWSANIIVPKQRDDTCNGLFPSER